jgi:hypothetical protein
MYRLRREDDSVYLYIKDVVLKPFIEKQEKEALLYIKELSTDTTAVYEIETFSQPSPFDRGRGMVYFDEGFDYCLVNTPTYSGTPEQSNRVRVYDENLNIIDDTSYMIDYMDGRIITTYNTKPAYIDYFWNYVSLVDEWSAITAADPPVVVLDVSGTDKKGYQLGGGKQVDRKMTLHIFASSTAERNDLIEVLYDNLYLKGCPLYELPEGTVLDYDGTFYGRRHNMNKDETLFSRATVSGTSNLMFENVSHRNINLPLAMSRGMDKVMLSDLNAYRAKITCDLRSYA